jgi:YVTN family beta-propeller protein
MHRSTRLFLPALTLWMSAAFAAAQHSPDGDAPAPVVLERGDLRFGTAGGVLGASAPGPCPAVASTLLSTALPPEGDTATAAAYTPNGTRLVVAHRVSKNLVVFDTATKLVTATIALSGSPNDVAISSNGIHAVTANVWEDTVSIVNLSTGAEIAVVPVGDQPGVVSITPNGLTAVVGNTVSQSVSVIDIGSATETFRILGAGFSSTTTLAPEPGVVTVDFTGLKCVDNDTAIHPDFNNAQIDFFDLSAGTVLSTACATRPRGVGLTPNGATAVISHFQPENKVSVVDTATRTVTKLISVANSVNEAVALDPAATRALVSVSNAVVVLDLVAGTTLATLNTASVDEILTTASGTHALCVGFRGSLIAYATATIVKDLNNVVSTPVGAVSPAATKGALIANVFGEDLLFVDTNGAAGVLEAQVASGPPPEADNTRCVAISQDGGTAVTTGVLSDTASVLDLPSGNVLAVVKVGDRPNDVEIAPDGSVAVVANLDSTFASVIDLTTFAVTNVPISTRGSEVEISPNSQYAYVAVVSGGDGVWRIDLNALATAGPKLLASNMGSTFSFLFNPASGMELSHNGATLAVCGSFDDLVTLIDTASWSVVANVPVGDFPFRALFAQNDSTIYVSNAFADTVSVINNAGAGSSVSATIATGADPFELALSASGSTLYVAQAAGSIGVIDLGTQTLTSSVPVAGSPVGVQALAGGCVLAASGNWSVSIGPGPKTQINLQGALTVIDGVTASVSQTINTGLPPAQLHASNGGDFALVPTPFGDGVLLVDVAGGATVYCTSKPSSLPACVPTIGLTGTPSVSAGTGQCFLTCGLVPGGANPGIYFYSTNGPLAVPTSGPFGFLCIQGPVTRILPAVSSGGTPGICNGSYSRDFIDFYLTQTADPNLVIGASVDAQAWYRDPPNPAGANFSNAVGFTVLP